MPKDPTPNTNKPAPVPTLALAISNTSITDDKVLGVPVRIIAYDHGILTKEITVEPGQSVNLPHQAGRTFGFEPVLPDVPDAVEGDETGAPVDPAVANQIKRTGDVVKKSLLSGRLTKK